MIHALYNEIDPYPAQWLRHLAAAGHIAPGDVVERSIRDLEPYDVLSVRQFHAFAGIGVWSYALRLAGWPDDRPVWTGSCPCQPFSSAGRGRGFADDRHLWPVWFELIAACRPPVIFGEQVASKDGLAWLDLVYADLEGAGYAVRAVDLCAAGVGAPHIRQRLYFVAYAERERDAHDGPRSADRTSAGVQGSDGERQRVRSDAGQRGDDVRGLADREGDRRQQGRWRTEVDGAGPRDDRKARGLADDDAAGRGELRGDGVPAFGVASRGRNADGCGTAGPGPVNGFWRDAEWIPCLDGKRRPVEPGSFPLAHGATARVGRLRAYGNAIVAHQAAEVVRAYLDAEAAEPAAP